MKSNKKKRLGAFILVFILCASMIMICAFFTDRDSGKTSGTAGNIDLVFDDISASSSGANGITSPNEFAIDQVWDNGSLTSDGNIINPGDYFDLSYEVTNTGSKSIDVRQQLVVTSNVAMTEGAEEFTLSILGGNNSNTAVSGTLSSDKLSITYDLTDITINGSREEEPGATDGKYFIRLDFSRLAGNVFMDSKVSVSMKAQAKQHRNTTDADWADWVDYETKFEQIMDVSLVVPDDTQAGTTTDYLLAVGDTVQLSTKASSQNGVAAYSSDRPDVLTVDETGLVTAVSVGTATITCTYSGVSKSVSFEVIKMTPGSPAAPTALSVSETGVTLNEIAGCEYSIDGTTWQDSTVFEGLAKRTAYTFYARYKETASSNVSAASCASISTAIPTAILYSDGSMVFQSHQLADTSKTVEATYTGWDTTAYKIASSVPWYSQKTAIKSVVINTRMNYSAYWFYGCTNLTSISLPDNLPTISNYFAFNCSSLKSITIPDSVTSIGISAFSGCSSLTSVVIPNSVTTIYEGAFQKTGLTSITIPAGVTSIEDYAFRSTNLSKVIIPNSVTDLGASVFSYCKSLKSVTIGTGLKIIGEETFYQCTSLTSITIPNNITSIGASAFNNCTSLQSIIIPDSVKTIDYMAFCQCKNLTSVTLGTGTTQIGDYAFFYCSKLSSITIPDGVTTIGKRAFNGSNLSSITLPASVMSIGEYAFSHCPLSSITFDHASSNSLSIGSYAFQSSSTNYYKATTVYVTDTSDIHTAISGYSWSGSYRTVTYENLS